MPSGRAAICPTCGRAFTEGELFCPYDRTALPAATTVQADPLINTVVNGSYTVLERLGAGGMGVVYKALQHRLNRHVALKVLSQRFSSDGAAVDRFRVEALAASQLTNGHTVTVHDFGAMDDGSLYIAMQLLEGETLRARLKRGTLSPRLAATIAMHVCESLSEAHELRTPILHRDIKPDNVFVRGVTNGNVHATVLDFGLARFADAHRLRLTSANVVLGTPAYMSPEQCRAQPLDPRSDLYAVGILLFEMLAGRPPFESPDATSLLFKHVYDPPPRPVEIKPDIDLPEPLEELILQLLAKSPADRPASAVEVWQRLEEIISTLPRLVPVAPAISDVDTMDTPPILGAPSAPASDPHSDQITLPSEVSPASRPIDVGDDSVLTGLHVRPWRRTAIVAGAVTLTALTFGLLAWLQGNTKTNVSEPGITAEARPPAATIPSGRPATSTMPSPASQPPGAMAASAPAVSTAAPVRTPAVADPGRPQTAPTKGTAGARRRAVKSEEKVPGSSPWDVD
jgi:serine/threonine-protein kinase